MSFDCRAGWPELQNYRAALANLWLWKHPELSRLHVWWEAKGFTDKSGALFYVGLGDMSNDSPDEARMSCPISSPSKRDGAFRFLTPHHARMLKSRMESFSADEPEMMGDWKEKAERSIDLYEGVKAPLGSPAWLGV